MHSTTLVTLATALFSFSASAAPLLSRSTDEASYCSPRIDGNYSTTISPGFYTGAAWRFTTLDGPDAGYPDKVVVSDIRGLEPTPAGVQYKISQWYGAPDQYRIYVGDFFEDQVPTCLAAQARDDGITGTACETELAAWTIKCFSCADTGGPPQSNCRFESTVKFDVPEEHRCATFTDFDQPMIMTDCEPLTVGDPSNPTNNPQQFIF